MSGVAAALIEICKAQLRLKKKFLQQEPPKLLSELTMPTEWFKKRLEILIIFLVSHQMKKIVMKSEMLLTKYVTSQ